MTIYLHVNFLTAVSSCQEILIARWYEDRTENLKYHMHICFQETNQRKAFDRRDDSLEVFSVIYNNICDDCSGWRGGETQKERKSSKYVINQNCLIF